MKQERLLRARHILRDLLFPLRWWLSFAGVGLLVVSAALSQKYCVEYMKVGRLEPVSGVLDYIGMTRVRSRGGGPLGTPEASHISEKVDVSVTYVRGGVSYRTALFSHEHGNLLPVDSIAAKRARDMARLNVGKIVTVWIDRKNPAWSVVLNDYAVGRNGLILFVMIIVGFLCSYGGFVLTKRVAA